MNKKLKLYRTSRGLSIGEAATLTGVEVNTYYKYESGVRVPRRGVMKKIASVMGSTIEALFFADILDNKSKNKGGTA